MSGVIFGGHHRFSLTRHSRDLSVMRIPATMTLPSFFFPYVQSLFHSRCLYPSRLHDSVDAAGLARYHEVRVRARPKKRKEKN